MKVLCCCDSCNNLGSAPERCWALDHWVESHAQAQKVPDDDTADEVCRRAITASSLGWDAEVGTGWNFGGGSVLLLLRP